MSSGVVRDQTHAYVDYRWSRCRRHWVRRRHRTEERYFTAEAASLGYPEMQRIIQRLGKCAIAAYGGEHIGRFYRYFHLVVAESLNQSNVSNRTFDQCLRIFGSGIAKTLEQIAADGMMKTERAITSPQSGQISVGPRNVINLCANNYLGTNDVVSMICYLKTQF